MHKKLIPILAALLLLGAAVLIADPFVGIVFNGQATNLTSLTPSTAEGTGASGPFGSVVRGQQRIPIRVAASTSFWAPR